MRKIITRAARSLLSLALVASAPARHAVTQVPAAAPPQAAWETYTFAGEEFSVALPEMPALDHLSRRVKGSLTKIEGERLYGAYGNGAVYSIRAYDNPHSHENFDHFAKSHMEASRYTSQSFEFGARHDLRPGTFPGKRYVLKRDITPAGVPASSLYVYLTKKHAYVLRVVGADDDHPEAQRFLNSFNLSERPAGRQIIDEWRLPRPPVVLDKATPASTPAKAAPASTPVNAAPEPVYTSKEVTRKVAVISRAEPPYTEAARREGITGAVRLRMLAGADGKIRNIVAQSYLPNGLTENAILVAMHIKFIPGVKDGRPVSQYITIEYNFNIY